MTRGHTPVAVMVCCMRFMAEVAVVFDIVWYAERCMLDHGQIFLGAVGKEVERCVLDRCRVLLEAAGREVGRGTLDHGKILLAVGDREAVTGRRNKDNRRWRSCAQ